MKTLISFFQLFTTYNLGDGVLKLPYIFYSDFLEGGKTSVFSYSAGVGKPLALMALQGCVYMLLALVMETHFIKCTLHSVQQRRATTFLAARGNEDTADLLDVDVAIEARAVDELYDDLHNRPAMAWSEEHTRSWIDAAILLKNLEKVYPPSLTFDVHSCKPGRSEATHLQDKGFKHAVRGVSLAIPVGETFGFLGNRRDVRFICAPTPFNFRVANRRYKRCGQNDNLVDADGRFDEVAGRGTYPRERRR
jgi:hypothetical protein